MVMPTVIGLIILNIYPLLRTVYMSFFKSGAFGKWTFVGLDNYIKMFQSAGFWTITKNTLVFMVLTVPVTVIFGLIIAVLLDQKIKGKTVFRAIYFLPMVVAPAAVAMVWKWLFNSEYGIINTVLGALHLPSDINWIADPKTALLTCAIVTIWSSVGYDAILLLSGLQSISRTYYEAARIDGATGFQQFRKITVPLVSPTLFFVLMMRVMASLKVFDIVYMMIEKTNPAIRSAETILYNFYQETFVKNNKGYGSALVVWCVILIAVITIIQFIGQKKWVTYDV
ncbi:MULTISPECIES: carbohydrate ABC transporter permease [Blautia]|uniref:Sugar ABC transporter permease n=2 Tax=Blautia TaxID=572511 RepID=A0ABR7FEM3_9FIRM|nr:MULTISPECIES: sugar ABC transporter permease [Blautia]MBS5266758.1 sugar ABC transporter permease [Clostridiales bacterium]MCI5961883.1 sugar ABC transporter permease [Clostridia bacterium]MCQ4740906.1 sugar ABC transporter permease [Blautia hominis]RHP74428.1 sugar ABC transporter permease [Blautia sp. OF01-4LB]RHS11035.1 sugar ABC transporter permease [Blautia sp. AF13-16]UOX60892.1 sugar ABC transporter permease [Clostridia bacterium UC5.1-1D4]